MFKKKNTTSVRNTKFEEEILAYLAKKLPMADRIILMDQNAAILGSYVKKDLPIIENFLSMVIGAYSIEERFFQEMKKGAPTYLLFASETDICVILPLGASNFLVLELPAKTSVDSSIQTLLQSVSSFESITT